MNKNFLLGTFAGGVVAAAVALLVAPKSGRKLVTDFTNSLNPFINETRKVAKKVVRAPQRKAVNRKSTKPSGSIKRKASQSTTVNNKNAHQ